MNLTLRATSWLATLAQPLFPIAIAAITLVHPSRAGAGDERRRQEPDLPTPICDVIEAPANTRLSAHLYAAGVQIYRWDGSAWMFIGPEATLYADSCYEHEVGTHYDGPTWEARDGSVVLGARLATCTPVRGAIPWLLLGSIVNSDHGKFARISYIQRVNTVGGTAPAEPGAFVGDEARVPYTAEYYFYRTGKN